MKIHYLLFIAFLIPFISCDSTSAVEKTDKPTNVEIVQGMYDNFAAGQVEPVLAAMHDSIVWNEADNFPYADGNPYIGPQAVLGGVFARLGADWDGFGLTVESVHPVGDDGVLATGRYKGKNKASGKELNAQFAHVWTLSGGKVTQFQQYTDTKHVAETMVVEEYETE